MSKQTPSEMLESAIIKLIFNKPFFANMLIGMKREFTTKVPTLGGSVTDTVNLYVNPHFFASLNIEQQAEILCHEVLHVVNAHMVRFRDLEPTTFQNVDANGQPIKKTLGEHVEDMMNASTLNQAADYAINEFLPGLPKKFNMFSSDGEMIVEPDEIMDEKGNLTANPNAGKPIEAEPCLVDNLKKKFPNIEKHKHLEYYYEVLKEERQKQKQQGNQGGQGNPGGKSGKGQGKGNQCVIDDHSMWNEGDAQDSEYMLEKIKQTVQKAVEATGGREAGKIPGEVLEAIERLNYKAKDWKSDLQKFVARTAEILIESSRKTRNRRYGILYPGTKVFPKMHLACAIDTSGSMPTEALCQIWAELDRIHKNGVEITVIEADCQIHRVYKFDPKVPANVAGRGGTAYQPALDKAAELDVDGLIYFGDMDSADRPKKPKYPVLWAIYGNQKPPGNFGMSTKIEIKKKK
jgi:predicted metal-dependent peptidase